MRGERFTFGEPRGLPWVAWLARGLLVTVGGVICWFLLNGVASAASAEHDGPATPEQTSRTADRMVDSATQQPPDAPTTGVDAVDRNASAVTQQADDAAKQIDDTLDEIRDVEQPDTTVDRDTTARSENTRPTRHHAASSRTPERSPHTTSTPNASDVPDITSHRATDTDVQPVELPVPDHTTVTTTAPALPTATTSDAVLFTLWTSTAPSTSHVDVAHSGSGQPPVSPD